MTLIRGNLGYTLLRWINSGNRVPRTSVDVYDSSVDKLQTHFGPSVFQRIAGKTVIDFGCGTGGEAVEFAKHGAKGVIGLEIQERFLEQATRRAQEANVSHVCSFVSSTDEKADLVLSLDSFEHFDEPATILEMVSALLKEDGEAWISFGLPWYHPLGGHLFSVFPWAHLVFSEEALIRWRSDFKSDGATQFREVAGGLNQMTIARFEALVADSSLEFAERRITPIAPLRPIHCKWTREFTTSLIFARLRKKRSQR